MYNSSKTPNVSHSNHLVIQSSTPTTEPISSASQNYPQSKTSQMLLRSFTSRKSNVYQAISSHHQPLSDVP